MEYSRVALVCLLVGVLVVQCSASTSVCGDNEVANPTGSCQVMCNACRNCGPCLCKTGYIRRAEGVMCITDTQCHDLHMSWMKEAKYENKRGNFFNCG